MLHIHILCIGGGKRGINVESKTGFQRIFLIFSNEDAGFEAGQKPSGHIRIEIRDGKGKLWSTVQNLTSGNGKLVHKLYLIKAGKEPAAAVCAGIFGLRQSRGELEWTFDPNNVNGSGSSINDFDVFAVITQYNDRENNRVISPLAAYRTKGTEWRKKFEKLTASPGKTAQNVKKENIPSGQTAAIENLKPQKAAVQEVKVPGAEKETASKNVQEEVKTEAPAAAKPQQESTYKEIDTGKFTPPDDIPAQDNIPVDDANPVPVQPLHQHGIHMPSNILNAMQGDEASQPVAPNYGNLAGNQAEQEQKPQDFTQIINQAEQESQDYNQMNQMAEQGQEPQDYSQMNQMAEKEQELQDFNQLNQIAGQEQGPQYDNQLDNQASQMQESQYNAQINSQEQQVPELPEVPMQMTEAASNLNSSCLYMNGNMCGMYINTAGPSPCSTCKLHNQARNAAREEKRGDIEKLKELLGKNFEQCDPFQVRRSDYKWWKIVNPVNLNNILYLCNIRSPLLFNPLVMMAHFKYRHLILGIFTDRIRKREYVVCGVPGMYMLDKKPFGDMCRFVQTEGSRPRYGSFGYFVVYLDPATGKILSLKE